MSRHRRRCGSCTAAVLVVTHDVTIGVIVRLYGNLPSEDTFNASHCGSYPLFSYTLTHYNTLPVL